MGSGFSGTATLLQLLRSGRRNPLHVCLIERGPEFCRGIAYAKTDYPYLLNVPASRMAATSADAGAFLQFARRRDPHVTGEDFLPRSLYGEYLQEVLEVAIAAASAWARVERVRGEVVELAPLDNCTTRLTLADGGSLDARFVVLASGAPAPRLATTISCNAAWPAVRSTPWSAGRSLAAGDRLLIIGTGLTMIDVVTAALHRQPRAQIHAISRHGLIPPAQTAFRPDALQSGEGPLTSAGGSLSDLVAAARALSSEAASRGGDWREVVTLLRRQAPVLWAGLPLAERARFLRHVRAYWDIHRHRAATTVSSGLDQARTDGRLFVHAGRVRTLDAIAAGVRVTWSPRGCEKVHLLEVSEAVDCSGPADVRRSPDPLWQSLLATGCAVADALGLGIRTGASGALVSTDGSISTRLFYIGPLLRADHWEATAVGELRAHAEQLATHLSTVTYQ